MSEGCTDRIELAMTVAIAINWAIASQEALHT